METLFCFDLDGTITRQELLPIMAAEIGIYDEINTLTEATLNGILPFEKSFLLRSKLLASIPVENIQKIIEKISLNNKIVEFIRANKQNCRIVTGNLYEWVAPLLSRLECDYYTSKAIFDNQQLISVTQVINKGDIVKSLKSEGYRIVAVGDGMGDIAMFEHADISVAFGGVHEPIDTLIKVSSYLTYSEGTLCRLLNTLS